MRYLVYGTGAVGGLIGGRLALAGLPVTFLARPAVAAALQRDGLRLAGGSLPGHVHGPIIAENLPAAFSAGESPDLTLLAVKAYDCEEAAANLAALGGPTPTVVCLTNGIGNEEVLARHLGTGAVLSAALTTAVRAPAAGLVQVERERGLDLHAGHPLTAALADDLQRAGFRLRLHADPRRMKWSKLLTNLIANACCAILGWSPDAVYAHPGLYRLEVEALREAVRVMSALGFSPEALVGVPLPLLAWALRLPPALSQPFLRKVVASGRGQKPPSLSYDIGRRRSEVGWLNGAVVRQSQALRLHAPANSVLTETLNELVQAGIRPEARSGQPARLLEQASRAGVPGIQGYNPAA